MIILYKGDIMRKIIITIGITVIFILITLLYAFGILTPMFKERIPTFFVIFALVLFIAILLSLIYTMIKRIKEIKEGKEDDISKY